MNRYEFQLHISSEAYLDYYRGTILHVIAQCATGQTVQFPASLLQRFVTTEGIQGSFVLTCDENNKCIGLQRQDAKLPGQNPLGLPCQAPPPFAQKAPAGSPATAARTV